MKYINTKTGAVVESSCECFGEDWELVAPDPKPVKQGPEKPKQKRTKKEVDRNE